MADGWRPCTLQHLLTHTAGAPTDFLGGVQEAWPDSAEELVAARRGFIAEVLAKGPESPRGEFCAHSNVGYSIAGPISESIAGVLHETLMVQKVFAPLELTSGGFGPPKDGPPRSARRTASCRDRSESL